MASFEELFSGLGSGLGGFFTGRDPAAGLTEEPLGPGTPGLGGFAATEGPGPQPLGAGFGSSPFMRTLGGNSNSLIGLGLGLMGGTGRDRFGQAQQGFAQGAQTDQAAAYRQAQMMTNDNIKEYMLAKQQGYAGSFQDWLAQQQQNQNKFGLNPVWGQRWNPQTQQYENVLFQTSTGGGAQEVKLPPGVQPSPQVSYVQTPQGVVPMSNRGGMPATGFMPPPGAGGAAPVAPPASPVAPYSPVTGPQGPAVQAAPLTAPAPQEAPAPGSPGLAPTLAPVGPPPAAPAAQQAQAPVALPPVTVMPPAAPAPAARPPAAQAPVVSRTQEGLPMIKKEVREAAREKELGTEEGKAIAALPQVQTDAVRITQRIDQLLKHPGLDMATGFIAGKSPVALTPNARDAIARIDEINSGNWTQAIQAMRGLGALSDREGARIDAARSRMATRDVSTEDFKAAARDLREVIQIGVRNSQLIASGKMKPYAPSEAAPAAADPFGIR